MIIEDLIEKGDIIIENNLIKISLRTIDQIKVMIRNGILHERFLRLLEVYVYLSEKYKSCKLVPLYGGGLCPDLYYYIALVPKGIIDEKIIDFYNENIKPRLKY